MNTNASASPSSNAASRTTTREGTRHTDPHTLRREGDRFERLLRDKSAARDEDDETQPSAAAPECAAPAPLAPLGQAPLGQAPQGQGAAVAAAVSRAGAAASDTASPTQAALGTAMAAQPPLQQAGNADAHTFDVSINEPMGLPLELRAVRVPAAGNVAMPAQWALNIAAPSRDANQLARHGSRLDERLRARGLDRASVRVDDRGDREEDPS
jgi:hypothetical protein